MWRLLLLVMIVMQLLLPPAAGRGDGLQEVFVVFGFVLTSCLLQPLCDRWCDLKSGLHSTGQ